MGTKKPLKRIDLKNIENPEFLKELSYKELNLLSTDIRDNIIESTSKNGGHLSSNLGVVEATIALCRSFDFSKDKIIFDVGHQCYTYKILTGRSLERLRQKDGVSGFQKIKESKYDCFECGHSSTSISAALGMALARDFNKEKYDIIAFIGDASLSNGLALEGLNNLAQSGHKVIIVFNDNDMSITKPVGGLAKSFRNLSNSSLYRRSKHAYQRILKKTGFGRWILSWTGKIKNWFKRHLVALNMFDYMGLSYVGPVDGHDIKQLEKAFAKAKRIDNSVVVHIKTIKGKGYKYAENDDSGMWHGVGSFDKETGKLHTDENLISWSSHYADAILKSMGEHTNAYTIVPATAVGSCLQPVFEEYPNRSIDVGIAEEHAFTLSGGLAISGFHPIISIYSTFLQRSYDELSHDLARMNLNATVLIDRSGLVGRDGNTHQGIYDESFLSGIPNTVIAMASRPSEAYDLVKESFNQHGVFCIRFPKGSFMPNNEKVEPTKFGKWKIETNKGKTAIVSVGPITIDLKEYIIKNNIEATLVNVIYQKPMDEEVIKSLLGYEKIIIYNAYATESGFAQSLAAKLMQLNYKGQVIIKAISDVFVDHASVTEQLEEFNLTIEDIIKLI